MVSRISTRKIVKKRTEDLPHNLQTDDSLHLVSFSATSGQPDENEELVKISSNTLMLFCVVRKTGKNRFG